MILIFFLTLIGGIIGTIIGYNRNKISKDGSEYLQHDMLMGFTIGFSSGLWVGLLIAMAIPMKTETKVRCYKLGLLQTNNSIVGDFFLGCGAVEGKMKYTYYYETNGEYEMNQIDCENVIIKYSKDNPRVEEIYEEPIKGEIINLFAFPFQEQTHYVFYVSANTIKQDSNLDVFMTTQKKNVPKKSKGFCCWGQ